MPFKDKNPLVLITGEEEIRIVKQGDPNLYLKKLAFIQFLSDPKSDTSRKGISAWSEEYQVDQRIITGWRQSREVQALVAQTLRERLFNSEDTVSIYRNMMKMIDDPEVLDTVKAQLLVHLSKMDMQRMELYLKYKSKEKPQDDKELSVEAVIEEITNGSNQSTT